VVERADGLLGGQDVDPSIVAPTRSGIEEEGLGLRIVLLEAP